MTLAVVSIVYGACLALVQNDIKKIIAYSSISHLGYVMLGLISLDLIGIQGAIVQMVSHGLTAAGLFLMVGMIYERCHTRELAAYGGLAKLLPVYSVFFMILTLASIGLPTTSGFTGEFLVLLGAFTAAWPQHLQGYNYPLIMSATAVTGVVLGALYMLRFAQGFLFGVAKAPHLPLVRPRPARKADPRGHRRRRVRAGTLPRRADAQDGGRRQAVPTARPHRADARQRGERVAHHERPSHPDRDAAGAHAARRHRPADRARDRRQPPRRAASCPSLAVAAAAAIAFMLHLSGYTASPFAGQFSVGPGAFLAKAVVLALAVPVLLMARDDFADDGPFYPLLLSSLYGFCLLMSGDSFLTLFLGLEIMSIPVYVMVLLAFRRPESVEAALKYLVLGGTATALFLMGISLLYGGKGSLALSAYTAALSSTDPMATTAVVLVLVAFFLKAAIVPFHAWAPDAYEGASVPVTAFMATIIKAGVRAGGAAAVRDGAGVTAHRRSPRHPAAGLDRLGQPHRDAADELPPHDRLLVDRPRRLPVLCLSRRGPRPIPGGRLLPHRLRADEPARVRVDPARRRRHQRATISMR